MKIFTRTAVLSFGFAVAIGAAAEAQPLSTDRDMVTGVSVTEADCRASPIDRLWVRVENRGFCVRFWLSTAGGSKDEALVAFDGDIGGIGGKLHETARSVTDESLQKAADYGSRLYRGPYIWIARPGSFGSSGHHIKDRRTLLEIRIAMAALDALKRQNGFKRFHLVGQSGGGHTVAGLAQLRSDIGCAVITSGTTSVRSMQRDSGRPMAGKHRFYDPIDHVHAMKQRPGLRLFVVSDRKDKFVSYRSQLEFVERVKAHNLPITHVTATATDKDSHGLFAHGHRLAVDCANKPRDQVPIASPAAVSARKQTSADLAKPPKGLAAPGDGARTPGDASDEIGKFVSQILGSADVQWKQIFEQAGEHYRAPTLVMFNGTTRADACGQAQSAMGPFYCPTDNKIYLDTSFFREIERRFNGCDAGSSACKFAQAYVIAHEIGHHVQNQLGILPKVQRAQPGLPKAEANLLQVKVELQADCFAGVWAARADKQWQLIQPGDVEAAMRTAAAIGDDRLQKQAQGYVVPDSFTHGSSEQRQRWFMTGLKSSTVGACNTFAPDAQAADPSQRQSVAPLISPPPPTSSANEPKKVKTLTVRQDNSGADSASDGEGASRRPPVAPMWCRSRRRRPRMRPARPIRCCSRNIRACSAAATRSFAAPNLARAVRGIASTLARSRPPNRRPRSATI